MIGERTLKNWRRDALKESPDEVNPSWVLRAYHEQQERILRLTQDLLDLHLMRKG